MVFWLGLVVVCIEWFVLVWIDEGSWLVVWFMGGGNLLGLVVIMVYWIWVILIDIL